MSEPRQPPDQRGELARLATAATTEGLFAEARYASEFEAREAIVAMMRSLAPSGLNQGKSGNASLRWHRGGEPGMLVTPSGLPYDQLGAEDLAWVPLDQGRGDRWAGRMADPPRSRASARPSDSGPSDSRPSDSGSPPGGLEPPARFDGPYAPSSEWQIHLDLHKSRPDARAVLHLHSPYATTLACLARVQRDGIPAFHYMIAVAGGADLRCAAYATFGTAELSALTIAALEERRACLMAHHGMIVLAAGLREAVDLAIEVESLCRIYWQALAVGEPPRLSGEEMERVLSRFASYGRARLGRST